MSLLIKGMDMPNDCAECDLSIYYDGYSGGYGYNPSGWWCRRLKRLIKESESNPADCPLAEIPTPHGRLIDADALSLWDIDVANYPSNYIKRAPTIIEAEE